MPTRCNKWFLLQILLLAQHVSGTTMPIVRSSRVLYRWLLPVVFDCVIWSYQKTPRILHNPKVHDCVHNSTPLVTTQSQHFLKMVYFYRNMPHWSLCLILCVWQVSLPTNALFWVITHSVITQKSAILSYFAAEAWNHSDISTNQMCLILWVWYI